MLDPRSPLSLESGAPHTRRGGQAVGADALPDLLLVERARAGGARAVEAPTPRYGRPPVRVARAVLGDEDAAELVAQEALTAAFGELNRHPLSGKFAAWLTRLAFSEARTRHGNVRTAAGGAPRPLSAEGTGDGGDAQERRELEHAVECLPEVFRAVFVLRVVEGISGTETAASLGVHETTVRTRIYRAQRRLGPEVMRRLRLAPGLFELEPARLERILTRVLAQRLHRSTVPGTPAP